MKSDILIVHAGNSAEKVEKALKQFGDAGYVASSINLGEWGMKEQSLKDCIDNKGVVVILISNDLFANRLLTFGIGYVLGKNLPLVSVTYEGGVTIIPSWYEELLPHDYTEDEILAKLTEVSS